ncbi:MAG: 5'-nucleotidase C-terminal domain-containing protein [Candidatus Eisenbacteria bacterium]
MRVVLRTASAAIVLAVLIALATGCAGRQDAARMQVQASGARTSIDDKLADDPAVDGLIAPYRETVVEKMSEPLAFSPVPMETDRPEGLLGALASDIVLARARAETGLPVEACVMNNGGLRRGLPPGTITLGLVYEVMPFDNEIVVLRLAGEQMAALAKQLAEAGGEPQSGFAFAIVGNAATDVRVGASPLESRDYWVATSDYLAGGGGGLAVLWEAQETLRTGVLVRDALADAFRGYGSQGDGDGVGAIPVPELGRVRRGR